MVTINLNLNSLATLLFCCELKAYKQPPLSLGEWNSVERVIRIHGLKGPSSLFSYNYSEFVQILDIDEDIAYKMEQRIKTIPVFLRLLDELESQGIKLVTKYDENYPRQFKTKLKRKMPIYFYYCGNLFNDYHGVTIAGLQQVEPSDNSLCKKIVDKAIEDNYCLICNDNKGVDEVVLKYALHHGAKVILFTCSSFDSKQETYRRYLNNGQLLMFSFVDPNRYFNVSNGLERNRLASVLADFYFVVSAKINLGSTWFSVIQNLHHNWSKIINLDNKYSGNKRLADMGLVTFGKKELISVRSFKELYEMNKVEESIDPIVIDQVSIFEFIEDNNELVKEI